MSYVQYLEIQPFTPSSAHPSILQVIGLVMLQNGQGKDHTNVIRHFPI